MNFEYRQIIGKVLRERQMRNSSYSLRSFARDLDISVTALSQVLSCKRDLSNKNLQKVAQNLCWSPLEIDYAKKEIKKNSGNSNRDEQVMQLNEDQFQVISNWYYLVILTILKQKNPPKDISEFSSTLGVELDDIKNAFSRLERLGLIKKGKNKYLRTSEPIRTTIDVPSMAIRKYHKENLELAHHAIDNIDTSLREISSMTMNIDPENMDEAKKLIVDFKRKFSRVMEKSKPKKAYTLAVHFYPATLSKENEQ